MTSADKITIESDEQGFELHLWLDEFPKVTDDGLLIVNIQFAAGDLLKEAENKIGPWYQEMQEAAYAFRCSPEDIDESGGYALDDPKHPDFHSVHADIWDAREGK